MDLDLEKIWSAIGDERLWKICGLAAGFGAVGGTVRAIARPPESAALELRRWIARLVLHILIGAVAAVALLYVNVPQSAVALIGGSVVAGYVGLAALDALDARFKLKDAHEQTARVADERDKAVFAAETLLGRAQRSLLLTDARARLERATSSTTDSTQRAELLLDEIAASRRRDQR